MMGVMAMFGKLRVPKVKLLNSKRCDKCGKFKIGKDCQCSKIWIVMVWLQALIGLIILLIAGDILVREAVNFSLRIKIPAFIVSLRWLH